MVAALGMVAAEFRFAVPSAGKTGEGAVENSWGALLLREGAAVAAVEEGIDRRRKCAGSSS
jgi:hypothetical protein